MDTLMTTRIWRNNMTVYFKKIMILVLAFVFLMAPIANGQANIYKDLQTPFYDPSSASESSTETINNPCATGGDASIDRLMQAFAQHESGGDPTAVNPRGPAYGKYQYLDGTWKGAASAYYPPASAYTHASDAPESVQDAVTYFRFSALAIKYDGSIWKMAVVQYYPVALDNLSYWMDKIPVPEAGNTETIRQFANQIVDWVNNGDGANIALKYKDAPNFSTWETKNGLTNLPAIYAVRDNKPSSGAVSTPQSTACSCSQALISTAMLYAWPTYHDAPYLKMKPAYRSAVNKAVANGVYVGGGSNPGVDCGGFVTLVMRNSGADTQYNKYAGNTDAQQKYIDDNPGLYENLGQKSSTDGLMPGDIAINTVHTYIYAGDSGFPGYNAISASFSESGISWRTPMASTAYFSNSAGSFTWYRLKCPGTTTQPVNGG